MAEEAVFPIKFPTDTSGITSGKSALEQLRSAIQSSTKELKTLEATASTLKFDADVQAFTKISDEIKKSEIEAAKLGAKMRDLQGTRDIAAQARVDPKELAKLDAQLGAVSEKYRAQTSALDELKKKRAALEGKDSVKLWKDTSKAIDETKASLLDNTKAFTRAGGDLTKLGEAVKDPKDALASLAEGANAAGSPLGGLAQKFQQLKALGPAGAIAAIVLALVALTVAAARAAYEFGRFVVAAADAGRSAGILREAATGSQSGARAFDGAISRIRANVTATREELEAVGLELARNGLAGKDLERTLNLSAIATKTMGDGAASTLKSLIDRGHLTKRLTLNPFDLRGTGVAFNDVARQLAKMTNATVKTAGAALQNGQVKLATGIQALEAAVKLRLGDLAKRQLIALPTQIARAKENLAGLFRDLDPGKFLGGLAKVLELLDETTETGRTLRTLAKTILQPLLDVAGSVFPVIRAFLMGMVLGIIEVGIVALKAYIALKKAFGGSDILRGLNLQSLAFKAGIAAVVAITVAIGAAVAVFGAFAAAVAFVTQPLWGLASAIGVVVASIASLAFNAGAGITAFVDQFKDLDFEDTVLQITNGIIGGLEKAGTAVADAFKKLAGKGVDAFKGALGIASPSKVFRAEAQWVGKGVALGVEDTEPLVSKSLGRLAAPEALAASAGPARGGSAGVYIDRIEINMAGGGAGGFDEVGLEQKIAEILERAARSVGLGAVSVGAT